MGRSDIDFRGQKGGRKGAKICIFFARLMYIKKPQTIVNTRFLRLFAFFTY
nr:MAG TPA: hypothetical protein [Bacteriophage sp.]